MGGISLSLGDRTIFPCVASTGKTSRGFARYSIGVWQCELGMNETSCLQENIV